MSGDREALFGTRWIHVFEQDSTAGEAWRPETADIPLSRRPRRAIELGRNGTARIWSAGDDDRPAETKARWREESGEIVVTLPATRGHPAESMRIVEQGPDLLRVKR